MIQFRLRIQRRAVVRWLPEGLLLLLLQQRAIKLTIAAQFHRVVKKAE